MRGLRLYGSVALVCGLVAAFVVAAPGFGGETVARPAKAKPTAARATLPVHDAESFNAALARARGGDTIQLADGTYPELTVTSRTYQSPVRIAGSRKAKLAGIAVVDSTNVVLQGVTVTPPAEKTAKITIRGSSRNVVVDGVLVDGRDERVGAFVAALEGASDITIRNSVLTNCGHGRMCIRPGATGLRIIGNTFFDCRSCDFIRGGGNGALVQGNSFDLAHNVECKGGPANCPHNDLIHIMGGGPWTIVGNRMGESRAGAGQIYANPGLNNDANPIHDLLIASNIFTGETGQAIRIGVGQKSQTPPPRNVRIVNNTVLSGARLTSVLLVDPWAQVPPAERPVVANNILAKVTAAGCGRARFVSNLVLKGNPCPGDATGDARLDPKTAAPTAQSTLVVDRADPQYAPTTDFHGRLRKGVPDRGAIELGGQPASPLQLTVPGTVTRRVSTLARNGWRLEVSVSLRGAETLRAQLLLRGRLLTTVTNGVTGETRHPLVVSLPAAARRAGVLTLRLQARDAGGRSISRPVTVRILQ